jgi:hypothetical protein
MARFMTLPFNWRKKDYTAFITLKPAAEDVHYTIVFNHPDLCNVIPDGELRFYGSEGCQLLDQYSSAASRDLINTIITELVVKYS